jgi:hypothetical protein
LRLPQEWSPAAFHGCFSQTPGVDCDGSPFQLGIGDGKEIQMEFEDVVFTGT